MEANGLLSPYRALDLADETGIMAGKILADLGADVIAVEPPSGNPVRRMAPFYKGRPHPERSLVWWAYASGKRSITLNLESGEGTAIFKRLAAKADFLFESFPPGYLDGLNIGHESLREVNPGLVMVSMTPFGQDGPYAHYQAPDLVGMALGGLVNLTGDPDRPPVRISEPQFGRLTGASGAAGAMIAHHYRILTGEGQHVDVSGQQAVARVLSEAPATWNLNQVSICRQGVFRTMAGGQLARNTWPCRDGHVTFSLSTGSHGESANALFDWMDEEGYADEGCGFPDWTSLDSKTAPQEMLDQINSQVERFFLAHTKDDLFMGALARRILLFPVNTPKDILKDPQLRARRFFTGIEHSEENAVFDYPGGFVRSNREYIGTRRRAPRLGEHNGEIYVDGLGLSGEEMSQLREIGTI
ncbi:MAG: CoA transferase [Dehalococcoidia bacterium]